MRQEKLISVIVTAYNIEAYICRCMDSLLAQTYKLIEIILVDDGSEDSTPELCDGYAEQFDNIRVIHQKNRGPSAARNAGFENARGDYIGYVDGDDWIEENMYEAMLKACLDAGAQIAICSYRQIGVGAEEIYPTGNILKLNLR